MMYSAKMDHVIIYKALKTLLILFCCAFIVGNLIAMLCILGFGIDSYDVVKVAAYNHESTRPAHEKVVEFGVDPGVRIFLHNAFTSSLVLSLLVWCSLMNPCSKDRFPTSLRKRLLRLENRSKDGVCDRIALRLMNIHPGIRRIDDHVLKNIYMILCLCPLVAMSFLGGVLGLAFFPLSNLLSLPKTVAYLLPHGIIEVPALVLTAAIPYGLYNSIRADVETGRASTAYKKLDQSLGSTAVIQLIVLVYSMLLVAGMVEGHLTKQVVKILFPE